MSPISALPFNLWLWTKKFRDSRTSCWLENRVKVNLKWAWWLGLKWLPTWGLNIVIFSMFLSVIRSLTITGNFVSYHHDVGYFIKNNGQTGRQANILFKDVFLIRRFNFTTSIIRTHVSRFCRLVEKKVSRDFKLQLTSSQQVSKSKPHFPLKVAQIAFAHSFIFSLFCFLKGKKSSGSNALDFFVPRFMNRQFFLF